jgi:hypothetical protein
MVKVAPNVVIGDVFGFYLRYVNHVLHELRRELREVV